MIQFDLINRFYIFSTTSSSMNNYDFRHTHILIWWIISEKYMENYSQCSPAIYNKILCSHVFSFQENLITIQIIAFKVDVILTSKYTSFRFNHKNSSTDHLLVSKNNKSSTFMSCVSKSTLKKIYCPTGHPKHR